MPPFQFGRSCLKLRFWQGFLIPGKTILVAFFSSGFYQIYCYNYNVVFLLTLSVHLSAETSWSKPYDVIRIEEKEKNNTKSTSTIITVPQEKVLPSQQTIKYDSSNPLGKWMAIEKPQL